MHAQMITLGSTGITTVQNGFGALPLQRDDMETAIHILRKAYDQGMRFFDTARAYSDSEEKLGNAFGGNWREAFVATKTMAKTPEEFHKQLALSLSLLKKDYIDIYQFHCASQVFRPGDGTGMYECMLEAKAQGKIKHIGITAHKIGIAEEAIASGLYETLQFPFSYFSTERELALAKKCKEANMGLIAMKGLAGGLITNAKAAFAFMNQFDNVIPIWGIQKEKELDEWLSFMEDAPEMTPALSDFIEHDKTVISDDFCRGCGYCMPCPMGIEINNCARISLMLRRAPSKSWLTEDWQKKMKKIETCLHCGKCMTKCPYELNTPALLEKNYEDYQKVLAGEVSVL